MEYRDLFFDLFKIKKKIIGTFKNESMFCVSDIIDFYYYFYRNKFLEYILNDFFNLLNINEKQFRSIIYYLNIILSADFHLSFKIKTYLKVNNFYDYNIAKNHFLLKSVIE